jgi:Fe-S-cluster containining protein
MSICSECAKIQKTCCQKVDIIVTDEDILRIKEKKYNHFHEYRTAQNEDYEQERDPNWDSYTLQSDGKRQFLIRKANGDCFFLTAQGCRLDMESRPLFCKLYPYSYNEEDLFSIEAYHCPQNSIPDNQEFLEHEFMLSKENATVWHKQFYQELRAGKIAMLNNRMPNF